MMERSPATYGTHVAGLPGCVAAAETRTEVCALIREAIEPYLEALEEDGRPIPAPQAYELIELARTARRANGRMAGRAGPRAALDAIAVDLADVPEAAQLLGVRVQQIARPPLVAYDRIAGARIVASSAALRRGLTPARMRATARQRASNEYRIRFP